jgi:uncharacterized membrane protein (UPF0127 family)
MPNDKKMITLSVVIALLIFAVMVGTWWYVFFGRPNPPLSQTSVSIQGASSSSGVAAVVSATGATASIAVTTPIVDGENPPLPDEPLDIDAATFNVEIASTTIEQTRGLSFRPSLGENDGMLFIFGMGTIQTFWMKDMNFPLDMIWISGNAVDGFAENVPAPAPGTPIWTLPYYYSPDHTDKVLEVNAGTVAKYNIKVGDTVTIGPS